MAIARAIRQARPPSIAFAAPLPMTSRTPFPARRRLAVIDRTKGSTAGMQSVGLGGTSGITLDTMAVRLSHTKIWASLIWICWTKDRTRSRSSSDASLVQRSASFADRSSTARWVAASRPSGATASLASAPDAKSARRRSSTSPSMSPAGKRRPVGCSERLRVISAVETQYRYGFPFLTACVGDRRAPSCLWRRLRSSDRRARNRALRQQPIYAYAFFVRAPSAAHPQSPA